MSCGVPTTPSEPAISLALRTQPATPSGRACRVPPISCLVALANLFLNYTYLFVCGVGVCACMP